MVIVSSVVFFLVYNLNEGNTQEQITDISNDGIKFHVQECLDKSANNMISLLAFQGGYISILNNSFVYDIDGVDFYVNYAYNNEKIIVSKEDIKKELDYYIKESFINCIDFSVFEEQGYDIEYSFNNINSAVNENNVLVNIDFPITVKFNDKTKELNEKYSVIVNARLGHVYDIVDKVVENHVPGFIQTTYLASFDVIFDVLKYDENTHIYTLTDDKSNINGLPLVFTFGVRYE